MFNRRRFAALVSCVLGLSAVAADHTAAKDGREELHLDESYDSAVEHLAETYRLDRATATQRIHDQHVLGYLVEIAEAHDDIATAALEHQRRRVVVRLHVTPGRQQRARQFVEDWVRDLGLNDVVVRASAAKNSRQQIRDAVSETKARFRTEFDGDWFVRLDRESGTIEVDVGPGNVDGVTRAAQIIADIVGERTLDPSLFAPVTSYGSAPDNLVGGGEHLTRCTSGFAVRDHHGPAIMTAGHCRDTNLTLTDTSGVQNPPHNTVALWAATHDGWNNTDRRDSQFHRIPATGTADPAIRVDTNGERRVITGIEPLRVGNTVCRFGSRSNFEQCGEVTVIDDVWTYDGVTSHGIMEVTMPSRSGDSGGPVYDGVRAVGIHSAGRGACIQWISGDCVSRERSLVTQIGHALGGTGFRLLGEGDSGRFVGLVTPQRISGSSPIAIGTGGSRTVNVRGTGGVPNDNNVASVVLNIASVNPGSSGNLTVYPNGMTRPVATTGSYRGGRVTSMHIVVPLDRINDAVRIHATSATSVTVDVLGYFYHDAGSRRLTMFHTPIRAGGTHSVGPNTFVDITLPSQIPDNAHAIVANVTAVRPTHNTNLRVYRPNQGVPGIANVNASAGEIIGNLITARVRDAGSRASVRVYNRFGTTPFIIDIQGYYDSSGDIVTAIPSTRVLDTVANLNRSAKIGANQTITVRLTDNVDIPAVVPTNARGVIVTLTAVNPSTSSYLTVSATGSKSTSSLNVVGGVRRSNSVVVPLNASAVRIYNKAGTTDLWLDVQGYVYD